MDDNMRKNSFFNLSPPDVFTNCQILVAVMKYCSNCDESAVTDEHGETVVRTGTLGSGTEFLFAEGCGGIKTSTRVNLIFSPANYCINQKI